MISKTEKIRKISIRDNDYPALLKEIKDAPAFLNVRGTLPKTKFFLAVVGARQATAYGLGVTRLICKELAGHDITIVSGMALGVDGSAHRSTLDAGGFSIGVLGNGLGHVYPKRHKDLYNDMSQKGALISEFDHHQGPLPALFPQRNRIISGLCHAVLVVEASLRSGSLITARLALEQGRDVFCVPGRIDSPKSKGTHKLIGEGAKLITSAADILEEFKMPQTKVPLTEVSDIGQSLTVEEKTLLELLGNAQDFQTLVQKSTLNEARLSELLLASELKGLVAHSRGQYIRRVSCLPH